MIIYLSIVLIIFSALIKTNIQSHDVVIIITISIIVINKKIVALDCLSKAPSIIYIIMPTLKIILLN